MIFPLAKRHLILNFDQHVAQARGGACDYEAAIGTTVYAPCDGRAHLFGSPSDEGGFWIGIHREDGTRIEFAHLSKRLVHDGDYIKAGQEIGLTGNTGTLTSGAHLHIQVLDKNNSRLDPEFYFHETNIHITCINGSIQIMQAFQKELLQYSAGMLTCSWDVIPFNIHVSSGVLTQDEAYKIAEAVYDPKYKPFRYLFMFYKENPTSTNLVTYYDPKYDNTITTSPLTASPRLLCFETGHALAITHNTHSRPILELHDTNFADDSLIRQKFREVLAYSIMTT